MRNDNPEQVASIAGCFSYQTPQNATALRLAIVSNLPRVAEAAAWALRRNRVALNLSSECLIKIG
jgi:hypothetical protein